MPAQHARSALARLTLLFDAGDGSEKVTYERRWPHAHDARRWCEEKVGSAPANATVLEIQVTEEVWGRRHAWEATAQRHIPETLQLGMRSSAGTIAWGVPLEVGSDLGRSRRD